MLSPANFWQSEESSEVLCSLNRALGLLFEPSSALNLISACLAVSSENLSKLNAYLIMGALLRNFSSWTTLVSRNRFKDASPSTSISLRSSPPSSASSTDRPLNLVWRVIETSLDYAKISPASKTPFAISITEVPVTGS